MEKGPNQPQQPGGGHHRRRRRRRGASGKKQNPGQQNQSGQSNQPNSNSNSQGSRPQGGRPQGGGGGGRRTNRGRRTGPAFVGPMDHSYRNGQNQNGNVSDSANRNGGQAFHSSR